LRCLSHFCDVELLTLVSRKEMYLMDQFQASELRQRLSRCQTFEIDWTLRPGAGRLAQLRGTYAYPTDNFRQFKIDSVSRWITQRLSEERFDLFLMETEFGALNLPAMRTLLDRRGTRAAVSFLDVLSRVAARRAAQMRPGLYRARYWIDAQKLKHFERQTLKHTDVAIAVSETDRNSLKELYNPCPVYVLPNGINLPDSLWSSDNRAQSEINLLFVGTFDYAPNEDAFVFFAEQILPLIQTRLPTVTFWGAGKSATVRMKKIAEGNPRIRLVGRDGNVREFYQQATICVVPIRSGGGTRFKILEAFAMGVPVVSTSIGYEGIDARNGEHLLIGDSPQAFADHVLKLLANPALSQQMVQQARQLIEEKYEWRVIAKQFAQYMSSLSPRVN
jgi:polysaccharide biosynthesis protein PslH